MKIYSILIICVFFFSSLVAQNTLDNSRFIKVTGSAEVNVSPDQIELEIRLVEYDKAKKTQRLNTIEKDFFSILSKHGIGKENIKLANASFYWYYWWSNRRNTYKEKVFRVTLDSETDFLALVKALDIQGVRSLQIANTSNKELQKLRKEVKIAAIKAAKEKANYLLESIDEKLGRVITVEEVPNNTSNRYWRGGDLSRSNTIVLSEDNGGAVDNVATIKLRYEVKVKFEIGE